MNNVSEKGSDFIQDLGDAVRKNPLSAALIGMGVLWLFAGSRPVERVGDFARSTGSRPHSGRGGQCFSCRSLHLAIGHRCGWRTCVVCKGRCQRRCG